MNTVFYVHTHTWLHTHACKGTGHNYTCKGWPTHFLGFLNYTSHPVAANDNYETGCRSKSELTCKESASEEERWTVRTAAHTFTHSCTNSRSPHKSNCSVVLLRASRVHMVYPPSCCSLSHVYGCHTTHTLMLVTLTAMKLHR